jgi:hypothetical protein
MKILYKHSPHCGQKLYLIAINSKPHSIPPFPKPEMDEGKKKANMVASVRYPIVNRGDRGGMFSGNNIRSTISLPKIGLASLAKDVCDVSDK